VYNNLTSVIPTLSFDAEADLNGSAPLVLLNATGPALPTACLEFFPKNNVLGMPSKTGGAGGLSANFAGLLAVGVLMMFV
jgi:hypothetical protein